MYQNLKLNMAIGAVQTISQLPLQLTATREFLFEPEKVLGLGPSSERFPTGPEVLIKWNDCPDYETSWEQST